MNLLPDGLPAEFTTADISNLGKISRSTAQQMAYCFRKAGTIDEIGKNKRRKKIREENLILKNDTSARVNNMIKILVTYASAIAAPRSFPVSKEAINDMAPTV